VADHAHCPGCGAADCAGCLPELDPPRYCTACGGWLSVRVTTQGYAARCRTCDATTT
jgi:hypothetical protein